MNAVVPLRGLEGETLKWCRRMMQNSPTALACLKAALNADEDGAAGCVLLGRIGRSNECLLSFNLVHSDEPLIHPYIHPPIHPSTHPSTHPG